MTIKLQTKTGDQVRWPQTTEDMAAVRQQLERLLKDPLFNQSRRYPRLLHRIVEDTLAGRSENLKERILGIELFDRAPDYDTNADAIVRVTAAEIRKRIAQYYHDEGHRSEPRIDLPVGGYVAEFAPPLLEGEPQETVSGPAIPAIDRRGMSEADIRLAWTRRRVLTTVGVSLALVMLLGAAIRFWLIPRNLVELFWGPFLDHGAVPAICVGQLPVTSSPQGPQDSLARYLLSQRPVSISDAVVVSQYATFLGTKEIRPRIMVSTETTYTDLRQHPVLLVGGLDNNWTLRFLGGLRFRMRSNSNSPIIEIYDSASLSGQSWAMDFSKPPEHVIEDYAIVSRFYSPVTENTVMIAAGLGEDGTAAAADFLLHAQYLKTIGRQPINKNVELVLKTQIIDGKAGPPVIVAQYSW